MAKKEETEATTGESGLAVDHDRVTMLSRKLDGTPDQTNPEIIGDKDTAIAANKEQLRQMSVSAVDAAKRAELAKAGKDDDQAQDATVDELKKAHEAAAADAESKAEAEVNSLHKSA